MAVNPWTLGSDVAMTFYQTRPGDAAVSGYRTIAAGVEPFRGQHVCIRFVEVDNQGFFHAGVDDIEVSLSADAPTSTPTSTATPTSTRTLTPTPTATPSPTTLGAPCADTNGDGVVTVSDVLAIARHLGRRRFDPHYDINRDGRVTVADLLIAVRQWRTRCEA
jgi:hypothetical protein